MPHYSGGAVSEVSSVAPGLQALAERLWLPDARGDGPVRVGYGMPVSGTRTVEQYVASNPDLFY